MYKIKLLILLSASILVYACTKKLEIPELKKFQIGYISAEYDGLLLSNLLRAKLENQDLLSDDSFLTLKANIKHSGDIYVTNIDNTSDRQRITTSLDIKIYDELLQCNIGEFKSETSQFYIFAAGDKYLSNTKALEKIKQINTEDLIKRFIHTYDNLQLENSCPIEEDENEEEEN